MWTRTARWAIAALIGSAMTSIGCGSATPVRDTRRQPIIAVDSVVYTLENSDVSNELAIPSGR